MYDEATYKIKRDFVWETKFGDIYDEGLNVFDIDGQLSKSNVVEINTIEKGRCYAVFQDEVIYFLIGKLP